MVESSGEPDLEQVVELTYVDATLAENDVAVVRSVVNNLPPNQRRAIEMAFFGGLTHQEIAETLHEQLGTIKARIRRGLLKLREDLKNHS